MLTRIHVRPSCFAPSFIIELEIPDTHDEEEYIDKLLDSILAEEFRWNCEWDFERTPQDIF